MNGYTSRWAQARLGLIALAGILGATLTGCGGSSSSVPGFGTNNGFIRFVNGSPDTGAVDVIVDGNKVNTSPLAYGGITAYQSLSATGTHTLTIDVAGTSTPVASFSNQSVAANGGTYTSLVISGSQHPVNSGDTLNLLKFNDTAYASATNGNVNFHNAASAIAGTQPSVNFGWFVATSPTTNQQLGNSQPVGGVTGPQALPTNAAASASIGFYAVSATSGGYTILPSAIDATGCATNKYPCNSGNLSLYLIDGPAASSQPAAGPYPNGMTSSSMAGFVGIFDANGQ